jgi:hypothetical protein
MARLGRAWWPTGLRVCLALAAAGRVAGSAAARPAERGPVLVADAGIAGGLPREMLPPGVKPPRFVPSYEWQRVHPGQAVPPGLWVKMDVRTGDTYAKFLGVCRVSGRAGSVCTGVCVCLGAAAGGGKLSPILLVMYLMCCVVIVAGGPEVPDPCAQHLVGGARGLDAALAELVQKFEHAKRSLTQV